jgi:hypothetical protein
VPLADKLVVITVVEMASTARSTYPLTPLGPETRADTVGLLAQCGGTLVGEIQGGVVCTWLAQDHGQLVLIVWPRSFRARFDPLEVLHGDGRVVARGGELVTLGGAHIVKDGVRESLRHHTAFSTWSASPVPPRAR